MTKCQQLGIQKANMSDFNSKKKVPDTEKRIKTCDQVNEYV